MRVLIREVRCRTCGTSVDPMCKYCPVCGTDLEEALVITIGDILKNIQDEIDSKLRMIEEREEALVQRENELEMKERDYRERLERLYRREHQLDEFEARLQEREIELARKYEEVLRKEKELNEKEHKLLAKEKEIVRMLAEIGSNVPDKSAYPEIGKKLQMIDEMLVEHEQELRKIENERQKIREIEQSLQKYKEAEMKETECSVCGSMNPPGNKRCRICGSPLQN
ncbi:MAG: hypothetical protein N3F63_07195 [Thermoplasmata archaeon]|nr:hypothetical protein [Thermoplasmata archaeon]